MFNQCFQRKLLSEKLCYLETWLLRASRRVPASCRRCCLGMLSGSLPLLNTGLRVLEVENGSLDLNILNWPLILDANYLIGSVQPKLYVDNPCGDKGESIIWDGKGKLGRYLHWVHMRTDYLHSVQLILPNNGQPMQWCHSETRGTHLRGWH
jgi:hypothetical protein